jgi:hypothetical protein
MNDRKNELTDANENLLLLNLELEEHSSFEPTSSP